MHDILFTLLELVVMIAAALVSAYLIPFIRAKVGNERFEQITQWVIYAVQWAEQILPAPGAGPDRKAIVIDFIKNILKSKNLTLTDEEIEVLIEAAVKQYINYAGALPVIEPAEAFKNYIDE